MGEYVININWGRGGGGGKGRGGSEKKLKTYLDGKSLLPAAVLGRKFNENSLTPDTHYGISDFTTEDGQTTKQWQIIQQGIVLSQANHFFWSRQGIGTRT